MVTSLTEFKFNDYDLIVHVDVQGNLWFRGTNVCAILGFSNSAETLRLHVNDYLQVLAIGEGKPALYLSEKGLYILCFRSNTPRALEFQLWAADVIQIVRKTGQYIATPADQEYFTPFGITLQQKLTEVNEAIVSTPVSTGKLRPLLTTKRSLEAEFKHEQKLAKAQKKQWELDNKDLIAAGHWQLILEVARSHFGDREFTLVQFLDWAKTHECQTDAFREAIAWLKGIATARGNVAKGMNVITLGKWVAKRQLELNTELCLTCRCLTGQKLFKIAPNPRYIHSLPNSPSKPPRSLRVV